MALSHSAVTMTSEERAVSRLSVQTGCGSGPYARAEIADATVRSLPPGQQGVCLAPWIDRHLPGGGLALGALHEVAGGGHGAIDGAAAALFAAGIAARTRGKVLWCITRPDLFAPALAQAGLLPDRVIYVEAVDEKSILAASRRVCGMAGSVPLSPRSRGSP